MALKEKDWVKVVSLRKHGQVVRVLRTGVYEVRVGEFVVQCQERDLVFYPDGFGEEGKETVREKKAKHKKAAQAALVTPEMDLHGMRVEEALKLVEDRINSAIMSGADGLRIVHGKGTGKIKGALHHYLRGLEVVKRFRVDEKNEGVTWVYF